MLFRSIEEREDRSDRHAYLHDMKAAGDFAAALKKDLEKYKLP